MRTIVGVLLLLAVAARCSAKDCYSKKTNSKLFCYYGNARDVNSCKCSHVILPAGSDVKSIEGLRDKLAGAKILLTVNEFNQGLVNTLNSTKVDGLEINLRKLDSKNDISDFISTVRSKLGSDLYLALTVPTKPETLAKYYDFKALSKDADVFILQTAFLGASHNVTFHPSRLSGLWDVQNTDSVVDLVSGLGAPLSKLVISAPVQGFQFTLQDKEHTAPGSPAVELSTITRDELCKRMESNSWTLERDQDQAGPYIFREKEWIAFEDAMSINIKSKYTRVRGLAGLALKDLSQDGGARCEELLLDSAFVGLSRQARAPRGAVLHSLEREILQTPARHLDKIQVSPYRITRVIDVEGKVNVIRQDTRTEFECSRQGYFVHPRSCGRFYRCVKFDQLSDEFSVFEFDCPAGLAFDPRVEVCVWPGSLPHASACSGSSEIAPVPKERFVCPGEPGYYADPENCRWFFACLDHGNSPLSAYEFRCPFGLVFDEEHLLCEWSWLVPKCASAYVTGVASSVGSTYQFGGRGRSDDSGIDFYDGLGGLHGVHLGGVNGPLSQTKARTYSSFGSSSNEYQSVLLGRSNAEDHANAVNVGATFVNGGDGYSVSGGGDYSKANVGISTLTDGYSKYGVQSNSEGDYSIGIADATSLRGGSSQIGLNSNERYRTQSNLKGYTNINGQGGIGTSVTHIKTTHDSSLYNQNSFGGDAYAGTNGALSGNTGFNKASSYSQTNEANVNGYHHNNVATDEASLLVDSGAKAQTLGFDKSTSYSQIELGSIDKANDANGYHHDNVATVGYSQDASLRLVDSGAHAQSVGFDKSASYSHIELGSANKANVNGYHHDNVAAAGYSQDASLRLVDSGAHAQSVGFDKSASYSQIELGSANKANVNGYQHANVATNGYSQDASVLLVDSGAGHSDNTHAQSLGFGKSTSYSQIELGSANVATNGYSQDASLRLVDSGAGHAQSLGFDKSTSYSQIGLGSANNQDSSLLLTHSGAGHDNEATSDYAQDSSLLLVDSGAGHQASSHYESNAGLKTQDASAGTIGIVGGGFSTVGKNVQILQHGVNLGVSENVTPLSLGVSSIPTVTAVPIPSIKLDFELYRGGVVANIPDLQYKLEHPSTINALLSNVSRYSLATTPIPSFVGYNYPKPSIKFEEGQRTYLPPVVSSTQSPVFVSTYLPPAASTKSSFSFVNQKSYVQPLKPNGALKAAAIESYSYRKPAQVLVTTGYTAPTVSFNAVPIKPAVLNTYTYAKPTTVVQTGGYHYDKPSITFEEERKSIQQPAVNYQEVKLGGYHYDKPSIAFEEKPVVYQEIKQSQPAITLHQEIKTTPAVAYHQTVQSQPTVTIQHKPQTVLTYHENTPNYQYEKPAVAYQNINIEKHEGYVYEKPAIAFEEKPKQTVTYHETEFKTIEKPAVPVVTYHQEIKTQPIVAVKSQPTVLTYHENKPQTITNYQYEKPAVTYQSINLQQPAVVLQHKTAPQTVLTYHESKPQTIESYQYQKPAVTYQNLNIHKQEVKAQPTVEPQITYQYEKPAVPVVTYHQKVETPPAVTFQQEIKSQPAVEPQTVFTYHENKPQTVESYQYVKPAVAYQNVHVQKHEGYVYEKPAIAFEEKPKQVEQKYVEPVVTYQQQPKVQVNTYHQTLQKQPAAEIVQFNTYQPKEPAVTYQEIKIENSAGYHYEKPSIAFEERPVVVQNEIKSKPPSIIYEQQNGYHYEKPAIKFEERPGSYQQINVKHYEKPAVVFEEKPLVTLQPSAPVQIKSNFQQLDGYHYEKPSIAFEEKPLVTYQQEIKTQPAVTYQQPQLQVQPAITIQEEVKVKPALTYQAIKQTPIVVENYEIKKQEAGYNYFEERPTYKQVLTQTVRPVLYHEPPKPSLTYIPIKTTISSTPKPYVQSKVEYEYPKQSIEINYENVEPVYEEPIVPKKAYITGQGYNYPKPSIKFEENTTPKPSFIESIKVESVPLVKEYKYYDSRYDQNYKHDTNVQEYYEQKPEYHEQSTVTYETNSKQSRPIVRYEFSSFDNQYNNYKPNTVSTTETVYIDEPEKVYLPVVTSTYLPPTTKKTKKKIVSTTTESYIEITSPSKAYLPVTEEYLKITPTQPSREYLPVTKKRILATRRRPSKVYLPVSTEEPSQKPSREYLPVTRKPSKKLTDKPSKEYLPVVTEEPSREYLPVVTGKPTVFVENYESFSTRRPKVVKVLKSKAIVKVNDFHPALAAKLGAQCTCVSNTLTLRKKQRVQDDDKQAIVVEDFKYTPDIDAEDDDNSDTSVTEAIQVFVKKSRRPVLKIVEVDEDTPSKQDIVDAVDTGLKLVKTAVKEGVKEGIKEATRDFDRYGPGGVRSRDETLQGTVDCQRAGLFRHPKHCNKFYACRWDCTKKKFTLHVFNCPVHLTFDNNLGACNWPSQGPACVDNTLLPSD